MRRALLGGTKRPTLGGAACPGAVGGGTAAGAGAGAVRARVGTARRRKPVESDEDDDVGRSGLGGAKKKAKKDENHGEGAADEPGLNHAAADRTEAEAKVENVTQEPVAIAGSKATAGDDQADRKQGAKKKRKRDKVKA